MRSNSIFYKIYGIKLDLHVVSPLKKPECL